MHARRWHALLRAQLAGMPRGSLALALALSQRSMRVYVAAAAQQRPAKLSCRCGGPW